jgi:uncharacterized protein
MSGPRSAAKLVEHGADVSAADLHGETAMFGLVRYIDNVLDLENGPRCVRILLDAGADRNAVNTAGKTPLAVLDPGSSVQTAVDRSLTG